MLPQRCVQQGWRLTTTCYIPPSSTFFLPNTRWKQGTLHLVTVSAALTSSRMYESGTTDFLETGRRGPTLAMLAVLCSPAAAVVAAGKAAAAVAAGKAMVEVATGKVEATAMKTVNVGDSTDEAVKAATRTVVDRPRLPAAMIAAPKPPKVVPPRRDATNVARRAIGGRLNGGPMYPMPRTGARCRCLPRVRGEAMQPLQRTGACC